MTAKTPEPAAAGVTASGAGAGEFAWPALNGRLLPDSYARAAWRCTLPVDAQDRLGLGFNLETGEVVRLSLDRESARHLAETVSEYLRGHELRPAPDETGGPSQAPQDRG